MARSSSASVGAECAQPWSVRQEGALGTHAPSAHPNCSDRIAGVQSRTAHQSCNNSVCGSAQAARPAANASSRPPPCSPFFNFWLCKYSWMWKVQLRVWRGTSRCGTSLQPWRFGIEADLKPETCSRRTSGNHESGVLEANTQSNIDEGGGDDGTTCNNDERSGHAMSEATENKKGSLYVAASRPYLLGEQRCFLRRRRSLVGHKIKRGAYDIPI